MKHNNQHDRTLYLDTAAKQTVCFDCVNDWGLKTYINDRARFGRCSFCGRTTRRPIAVRCDLLVRYVNICLHTEYDDAGEIRKAIPDADELCLFHTTRDLLRRELPHENNKKLLQLLVEALGNEEWCSYIIGDKMALGDNLVYGWEEFCHCIKHERRYFFFQEKRRRGHYDYSDLLKGRPLTPAEVLDEIGRASQRFRLVTTLKKGTCLFRARHPVEGIPVRTPLELGPPNEALANKANRMSPAGIVMFYASDDPKTAIAEIRVRTHPTVVGTFVIEKDIRILDLSCLPPEASIFVPMPERDRGSLEFLHHFCKDLSTRVKRDGYEHVDYAPTQVVTEWFRTIFRHSGQRINGICYPSTQHVGGRSLVLFANQSDIVLPKHVVSDFLHHGRYPTSLPSGSALLRVLAEQEKPWLKLLRTRRYGPD
jgi:hypothetical protein